MPVVDRFERIAATRIVADPAALDCLTVPGGGYSMRLAPDDLLLVTAVSMVDVADRHAIIEPEGGFSGAWLEESQIPAVQAVCGWEFPRGRPAFAQGLVAGVPAKLLFAGDRTLVLVPTVVVSHFVERVFGGEPPA